MCARLLLTAGNLGLLLLLLILFSDYLGFNLAFIQEQETIIW